MNEEKYLGKLGLVLDQDKYSQLEEAQRSMKKKKITVREFYQLFESLVGKNIALRLFPVIAANLPGNQELTQKEMDEVYME